MAARRSPTILLPMVAAALAACALLRLGSSFVPAPTSAGAALEPSARFLQTAGAAAAAAALSSGAALPALAEEISSDEAYNQKVL
eukprot:CAMPEP_0197877374 /NCGR_PEP_ID=MMETSP1439-20131203/6083_1 /TAXON_ID=66791 /ORGANISM="Gonyaulax spinifera, Strain CCMP409" /LENGTH=84 /DNA_ID=CAMNT_0043496713 /DNA_START=72 /DNA_END=323 /DNA_ORIENTATION=+